MNVEIAQRLAAMRREKGYSQEELANRLGLSRQAVSKWERAESSPDTGNLIALADLYGVTLDELVRVDVDISDDVRFEEADKEATAEVSADVITAAAESVAASTARAEAAAQVHELKTSSRMPSRRRPRMLLVRRERHRIHRNRHHPIRRRAMLRRRPTDSTHPHVPRIVLGRRFRIPCCA